MCLAFGLVSLGALCPGILASYETGSPVLDMPLLFIFF